MGTHIPLGATRLENGKVEVWGLGRPAVLTDLECEELIGAIEMIDQTLDPDDLYDRVCATVVGHFEI